MVIDFRWFCWLKTAEWVVFKCKDNSISWPKMIMTRVECMQFQLSLLLSLSFSLSLNRLLNEASVIRHWSRLGQHRRHLHRSQHKTQQPSLRSNYFRLFVRPIGVKSGINSGWVVFAVAICLTWNFVASSLLNLVVERDSKTIKLLHNVYFIVVFSNNKKKTRPFWRVPRFMVDCRMKKV